jgi:hypothetical protein
LFRVSIIPSIYLRVVGGSSLAVPGLFQKHRSQAADLSLVWRRRQRSGELAAGVFRLLVRRTRRLNKMLNGTFLTRFVFI